MPDTAREVDVLLMTNTGAAGTRTRAATFVAPTGTLGLAPAGGYRRSQAPASTHAHTSITEPGHRTAIPL